MADVIKERGWFWWGNVKLPKNHFAPENYVPGTLSISDDGRIEIELDDVLPSYSGRRGAPLQNAVSPDQTIAGLLKSTNQHLLAMNLHHSGGKFSSNGISFDKYVAQSCLLSNGILPAVPRVKVIEFSLSGFEEWLRLGPDKHERTSRSVYVRYKTKPEVTYKSDAGVLTYKRRISSTESDIFGARGVELKEFPSLRYSPPAAMDIPTAIEIHGLFQDFMVLITGSEFQVTWPKLLLKSRQYCDFYFFRNESKAESPAYYDCIMSFPEIKEIFGNLFFSWLNRRRAIGPGSYLYLATRRGMHMYEEHKFMNLVSGLESLHRHLHITDTDENFKSKMERILGDIKNSKDRAWLRKRTRNFGEPSLEQRILELFSSIPADLEEERLVEFCKSCAKIRNDLSHLGHSTSAQNSSNSVQFMHVRNMVISYLYHAKLMLEIGVPREIVERWFNNSRDTFRINWFMVRAGLKPAQKPTTF